MADIVNLRMVRKARKRVDSARDADAARAKSGETKGERQRREADAARLASIVDGAFREPD